jgi:hypothetical protein
VNFVNDIDLEPGGGGGVFHRFAQLPDLFDTIVTGAVNLEHVDGPAFSDFHAARIGIVEIDLGPVGAIETFGENAGDRGFARSAGSTEQIGVGDPILLNGVGQSLRDMLLADDIRKTLRTILSRDDLISHGILNMLEAGLR